jgi:hypothetical protein
MRVGRYINEVCLLFNVEVLVDIANGDLALCDGYKVSESHFVEGECVAVTDIDTNHDGSPALQVRVSLGVLSGTEEPFSFNMTRWYPSEDELDEFCELNINRFRIAAKEYHENCAPVPDATDWR